MLTLHPADRAGGLDRGLGVEPGDEAAAAAGEHVDLSVLDRIAAEVTVALALGLGAQVELDRQVVDAGDAEHVRPVGGVGVGGRARRHDSARGVRYFRGIPRRRLCIQQRRRQQRARRRAAVSSEDRGENRTKPYRWGKSPRTGCAERPAHPSASRDTGLPRSSLESSGWRVEYTGRARPYNPVERLKFRGRTTVQTDS